MATAELVRNAPNASSTEAAIPLLLRSVPGSTQPYEMSPSASTPVFFTPGPASGLSFGVKVGMGLHLVWSIWQDLFRGGLSGVYAFVPKDYPASPVQIAELKSTAAWDRLGLELMRIASLKPNWDGEGAEAVPPNAITNSAILLSIAKNSAEQLAASSTSFQTLFSSAQQGIAINTPLSLPTIFPSVEGAVTLKWIRGTKELKCTIFADTVEVIRWKSLDRYESDDLWEVPVQKVAEHFEWLLR